MWRLAFHFNRPVSELNITRREFNQALAYLQLNPPEEPATRRTASLLAQIANFAGKSLKKGKTVTADDYLGKAKEPEKRQTSMAQKAFMQSFGKKDK